MNNEKKKELVKTIATCGLLLACALFMNLFRITLSFGGRISFSRIFLSLAGILYGPLYGGIVYGLSDVISYLIAPVAGFIWQLTLISIIKGVLIGLIWSGIKNLNFKLYNFVYLLVFALVGAAGFLYTVIGNDMPTSIMLIVIGLMGLLFHFSAYYVYRKKDNSLYFERYLRLIAALVIPGILGTTANTFFLMKLFAAGAGRTFIAFLIPRLVLEIAMSLISVYIIVFMLNIYDKVIKNSN